MSAPLRDISTPLRDLLTLRTALENALLLALSADLKATLRTALQEVDALLESDGPLETP